MRLDVRRLNRILSYLFEDIRYSKDDDRELPMKWSMMHMYSSSQLAVLTGLKKGLDPEILGIIAALHDVGAIYTKKRENHAKNASSYVKEILSTFNSELKGKLEPFTNEEINLIHEAVINHSDKSVVSTNKYVEAMKDIDSLDRYLHGIPTENDHLKHLKKMLNTFDINIKI